EVGSAPLLRLAETRFPHSLRQARFGGAAPEIALRYFPYDQPWRRIPEIRTVEIGFHWFERTTSLLCRIDQIAFEIGFERILEAPALIEAVAGANERDRHLLLGQQSVSQ